MDRGTMPGANLNAFKKTPQPHGRGHERRPHLPHLPADQHRAHGRRRLVTGPQRPGVPARRVRRERRPRRGGQPAARGRLLPAQPRLRDPDHADLGEHRERPAGRAAALGEDRRGSACPRRAALREPRGVRQGSRPRPGREPAGAPRRRPRVTYVADPALTPRAEQTRAAITEAALALFRERGYEATTMRAIAERAGVSTGNAYYYFGSKEELIQEFYARNHADHRAASRQVLAAETDLAARLTGTVRALVEVLAPYHSFAATFYKHAAEPASPLSPFSPQSSPARLASIALYREVVDGSTAKMGAGVRERLPELLWLYSLGITLYWVHDTSPRCNRTHQLIDATVPVI